MEHGHHAFRDVSYQRVSGLCADLIVVHLGLRLIYHLNWWMMTSILMHNSSGQGKSNGNNCASIPTGLVGAFRLYGVFFSNIMVIVRDLIIRFLVIDPNARLAFGKAMVHPWFTYLGLSRRPSITSISSEEEVERMLLCDTDIDEPCRPEA